MLPHVAPEEPTAAVEEVAGELLAECGQEGPPVDALRMAAQLALTVAWDDLQQPRARCVRIKPSRGSSRRGAILLRPEPRQERRQWAVAHELGEHFAWRVFELLSLDPANEEPGSRETVANRLASALLLPLKWFAEDAPAADWDLFALKQRYSTASHELIARRMLDCAPAAAITIFDNSRRTLRLGNRSGFSAILLPIELACWRAAHDLNVPVCRQANGATVQAWPIHEPGWQREILRTTMDEYYDA